MYLNLRIELTPPSFEVNNFSLLLIKITVCWRVLLMKKLALLTTLGLTAFAAHEQASAQQPLKLELDARYDSGVTNEDGGTTEIVAYNVHNNAYYVVNGTTKKVEAIAMDEPSLTQKPFLTIDVENLLQETLPAFEYGGLTSVAVHPHENIVAYAIQARDYNTDGLVVVSSGDGELLTTFAAGKQPDNLTFTPDGSKLLIANEGEPREGYGEGAIDPQGSVTVIDLSQGLQKATPHTLTFEKFDTAKARAQLVEDQVILKKGALPSADLEPEYISVSHDSRYAYVALQENNAVATIDLQAQEISSVKGLGFKNHTQAGNEIDLRKDGNIQIQNENYQGIYMPDGIAVYTVGGKNYIVTANEGDSREWGTHVNEVEVEVDGNEIVLFDTMDYDGFEENKQYIFGGRSFSIFEAETMDLVFDSGANFEKMTAAAVPDYFNSNNTNTKLDNRSGKKGPEPEDVKVGEIDGKTYAFIGLERVGGVMMYDITNPRKAKFVDYLNTRDYSEDIKGDVSPEGLAFVSGEVPKLIIGHEVSGTVVTAKITDAHKPITAAPFLDTKGHWAQEDIDYVFAKGFMKGINANEFRPNKKMTRAQAAVALQRVVDGKASAEQAVVQDISEKAHYYEAVQWAVSENIIATNNQQQFMPSTSISRADYALAVYKVLKNEGVTFDTTTAVGFTDIQGLSAEHKEAITALANAKIMNGTNKITFNPLKSVTRAQAAAVLSRSAK